MILRFLLLNICIALVSCEATPMQSSELKSLSEKKGRSLFDYLIAEAPDQKVPYPFTKLKEHLAQYGYVVDPLIPVGRSLQRGKASPNPFKDPRRLLALRNKPETGLDVQGKLFVAYVEGAKQLEVVSFNESTGEDEFQTVSNYDEKQIPKIAYEVRSNCVICHQNGSAIFARLPWTELNGNRLLASILVRYHGNDLEGAQIHQTSGPDGGDASSTFDGVAQEANSLVKHHLAWREMCGDDAAQCRSEIVRLAFYTALLGDNSQNIREALIKSYQTSLRKINNSLSHIARSDSVIPNRKVNSFGLEERFERAFKEKSDGENRFDKKLALEQEIEGITQTVGDILRLTPAKTEFWKMEKDLSPNPISEQIVVELLADIIPLKTPLDDSMSKDANVFNTYLAPNPRRFSKESSYTDADLVEAEKFLVKEMLREPSPSEDPKSLRATTAVAIEDFSFIERKWPKDALRALRDVGESARKIVLDFVIDANTANRNVSFYLLNGKMQVDGQIAGFEKMTSQCARESQVIECKWSLNSDSRTSVRSLELKLSTTPFRLADTQTDVFFTNGDKQAIQCLLVGIVPNEKGDVESYRYSCRSFDLKRINTAINDILSSMAESEDSLFKTDVPQSTKFLNLILAKLNLPEVEERHPLFAKEPNIASVPQKTNLLNMTAAQASLKKHCGDCHMRSEIEADVKDLSSKGKPYFLSRDDNCEAIQNHSDVIIAALERKSMPPAAYDKLANFPDEERDALIAVLKSKAFCK